MVDVAGGLTCGRRVARWEGSSGVSGLSQRNGAVTSRKAQEQVRLHSRVGPIEGFADGVRCGEVSLPKCRMQTRKNEKRVGWVK